VIVVLAHSLEFFHTYWWLIFYYQKLQQLLVLFLETYLLKIPKDLSQLYPIVLMNQSVMMKPYLRSIVLLQMEMNEAILEVLGKPTQPAVEYIYRQTSACLTQLGLMGVGSAVFADPAKEFFEP